MRASWLEHSCLLASCVSLLFLIQAKRGLTRAVWVGWSARWHFLVLRAHPVFQLIIIQRETVNIKGCFAASEKCHTLAFIDTHLQEKRKKRPLNVFTMTAVQVSRLIDFYFLLWLCWYFRFVLQSPVCPLCPSLSAFQCLSCLCYHAVTYLSWGYFRLVFCCVVFLFLIPVFVLLLFPDCLQLAFIPVWIICVSIGFYFVLPCDFVYLDYWSANKGFC